MHKEHQKRPKKRKHRPKVFNVLPQKKQRVVSIDKANDVMQNYSTPITKSPTKRKHTHKRDASTMDTPPDGIGDAATPANKRFQKSVQRTLHFDSEATQEGCTSNHSESLSQHKQASQDTNESMQNVYGHSQWPNVVELTTTGFATDLATQVSETPDTSFAGAISNTGSNDASINNRNLITGKPQMEKMYGDTNGRDEHLHGDKTEDLCLMMLERKREEIGARSLMANSLPFQSSSLENLNSSKKSNDIYIGISDANGSSQRQLAKAPMRVYDFSSLISGIRPGQLPHAKLASSPRQKQILANGEATIRENYAPITPIILPGIQENKIQFPGVDVNPINTELAGGKHNIATPVIEEDKLIVSNSFSQGDPHHKLQQEGTPITIQFDRSSHATLDVGGTSGKTEMQNIQLISDGVSAASTSNQSYSLSQGDPHHILEQEGTSIAIQFDRNSQTTLDVGMSGKTIEQESIQHIGNEISMASTPSQEKPQLAIVPYDGIGMIVPSDGTTYLSKKTKTRAKVDLDPETNRVWLLLMEKEGSAGAKEGADKEQWWEEQRHVFRGRVISFIARMHLGNRRFSLWKGSVVDSVIGVFLTQNVSDHLSSSAFMALVARFPVSRTEIHEDEERGEAFKMLGNDTMKQKVNSRIDDPLSEDEWRFLEECPSFMELLQMAEMGNFDGHGGCSRESIHLDEQSFDWNSLRQANGNPVKKERNSDRMDSVDWEAVRNASVKEISSIIRERGMNNILAQRIKDFLDRLVREHGSIDLEWLRDIPTDEAKDYLLSIRGLGLKSTECVRLLTLHHLAFPVDTNVGRICVRLGWVPLQPLPESLQLHLLEEYPLLDTIQKYLWPRLCKLDQKTLYELHYQLITFGKVFCTKSKPNCNACPMKGECKHFASAFASARLPLPGLEEKRSKETKSSTSSEVASEPTIVPMPVLQLEGHSDRLVISNCKPIIEEPPEHECMEIESLGSDIEDISCEIPDEIPVIKLNGEHIAQNLQNIVQENLELQGDMSKALMALTPMVASIPQPKLKNVSRLRTEHQVYELPDSHPLLQGMDSRESDDPCPYLLAIWTPPGETDRSTEAQQMVRGTLLIPCRTAMRGSFPLNGTYFQVNEP